MICSIRYRHGSKNILTFKPQVWLHVAPGTWSWLIRNIAEKLHKSSIVLPAKTCRSVRAGIAPESKLTGVPVAEVSLGRSLQRDSL